MTFTIVEHPRSGSIATLLVAVLLIGLLAAGYFVPRLMKERRWANERAANSALRLLASAEFDFRANDRDRNGIQDFWTADVAGLYTYGLIPREIAEADAAPLVPLVPHPIPYRGHYFKALIMDDSETPPIAYRQVTDNKSGATHNLLRFGFVIYPAGGLDPPHYMWIINENYPNLRSPSTTPLPSNWPHDNQLKSYWSKTD